MRAQTILLFAGVAVVGIVLGVYLQSPKTDVAPAERSQLDTLEPTKGSGVSNTGGLSDTPSRPFESTEVVSNDQRTSVVSADCDIYDESLRGHPLVVEEELRIAPLLTDSVELEAYRGLSQSTVEELAAGGDSLAMAAAGYAELKLAGGVQDIDAVDYHNEMSRFIGKLDGKLGRKTIDHVDRATYWLYEAALNGRVQAYADLEAINRARYGDVQKRGWLNSEEIAASGKTADVVDAIVQHQIMLQIEPQLADSLVFRESERVIADFMKIDVNKFLAANPRVQSVIDEQVEIFQRDREAAGLRPVKIPPPRKPIDEMITEICSQ